MSNMYIERKQDISMYYFLEDLFDGIATVRDGFPDEPLETPTISVDAAHLNVYWIELGSRTGYDRRVWMIDVFADNKTRRDDFAYLIKNELQNGVPVYNYDEGFPPAVTSQTQEGLLVPMQIELNPIPADPMLVSKLKWRTNIKFISTYERK